MNVEEVILWEEGEKENNGIHVSSEQKGGKSGGREGTSKSGQEDERSHEVIRGSGVNKNKSKMACMYEHVIMQSITLYAKLKK